MREGLAEGEWHPVPAWQARLNLVIIPPSPCDPYPPVRLTLVAAPGNGTRILGWGYGRATVTVPRDAQLLAWDHSPLGLVA
jgi:hypothetical protein